VGTPAGARTSRRRTRRKRSAQGAFALGVALVPLADPRLDPVYMPVTTAAAPAPGLVGYAPGVGIEPPSSRSGRPGSGRATCTLPETPRRSSGALPTLVSAA
jgi:hypothetical protein